MEPAKVTSTSNESGLGPGGSAEAYMGSWLGLLGVSICEWSAAYPRRGVRAARLRMGCAARAPERKVERRREFIVCCVLCFEVYVAVYRGFGDRVV